MRRTSQNKSRSIFNGHTKWPVIFAAIGLILIYYVFFHGEHGLIQYWRLLNQRKQLNERLVELKQEQEQLKKEIELLKHNYQYIETIARERYKMGRENEKVFVIVKD